MIYKSGFIMIYIGFSTRSHKILAKIFCKKYRHCGPILVINGKYVLYQFVKHRKIIPIVLRYKDIKILKQFGWFFIKYETGKIKHEKIMTSNAITCVQFTKRVLNIKKIAIQTPDALLKYLNQTMNK